MQILLKLFEQLLAPIVNGQPGEAEVAADLVALLGSGVEAWDDLVGRPTKKTQKISAWKLKMMGLGSHDLPQFHVPMNVQLYSKSSFFWAK